MADDELPDVVVGFTLTDGRRAHARWVGVAVPFTRTPGPDDDTVWLPEKLVITTSTDDGATLVVTGRLRVEEIDREGSLIAEPPPFDVVSVALESDGQLSDTAIGSVTPAEIDLIKSEALAEAILFVGADPFLSRRAEGSARYAGDTRRKAQLRHRGPKGPTDEQLAQVREAYASGLTLNEVGEKFGISESTAHRWVRRAEREGL